MTESSIPKTIDNNKGTEDTFEIESNISKIDNSDQKDTVKTTNKSIMIGNICGAIAALVVGGGCFAAGIQLSILALIGIAVAAAILTGFVVCHYIQTLVKMALEPEWEVKLEPNTYGFRPGRSCHDAIEAIFDMLKQKTAYVLDADIAGCFDNINHNKLLEKLNKLERNRMRRKVSRTVLKSSEEGRPSSFRQQYAEETTDEDLRKIAEKSPIIKLAYDELDKFHWNEKDLVAYEERVMDLQKEAAILEQKLDDATQKGRQEEKIEVAKNSLKAGVSIDVIAEITGLSLNEIVHLKKKA